MSEEFGFFDPVEIAPNVWDREYNADEFTVYFGDLVTTGVMKGKGAELKVTANGSNMITEIDSGVAYIEGRRYANTAKLAHTHDTETLGKNRIDRIVVRMDLNERWVKSFVKKGVASASPVAPALTQTANLYEISLAQVKVVGGQTYVNVADVVDERGEDVICPWAGSNILPNFNDASLAELVANQLTDGAITKSLEQMGITNLNDITKTGFYSFNTNLTNIPSSVGSYGWNLMIFKTPQGQIVQIAHRTGNATEKEITEYSRAYAGGVWGQWFGTATTNSVKLLENKFILSEAIKVPLSNGWTGTLTLIKDAFGMVFVEMFILPGTRTAGVNVGAIPFEYRPASTIYFDVQHYNASGVSLGGNQGYVMSGGVYLSAAVPSGAFSVGCRFAYKSQI